MKKPTQAVYVRWFDCIGREGWSRTFPRASMEHRSIAWLVDEDEESIVISTTAGAGVVEDGGWDYTGADLMRIPRCAILKMHVWKPPAWVILD